MDQCLHNNYLLKPFDIQWMVVVTEQKSKCGLLGFHNITLSLVPMVHNIYDVPIKFIKKYSFCIRSSAYIAENVSLHLFKSNQFWASLVWAPIVCLNTSVWLMICSSPCSRIVICIIMEFKNWCNSSHAW